MMNFGKMASLFINSNSDRSKLVRYAIEIFANLLSFKEEVNRRNAQNLTDQGALDAVLNCITSNMLNSEVLMASVKYLDYLCSYVSQRELVASKGIFNVVFSIIKSQDWNENLVLKFFLYLS